MKILLIKPPLNRYLFAPIIGEPLELEYLASAAKEHDVEILDMRNAYMKTIKNLHKNKIAVCGAIIFGFDNDDLSSFDETLRFCLEADVDIAQFSSLIPFPGTPLYDRLTEEGRIITRDWSKYTYEPPGKVFLPKNMTCEELGRNIGRIYREFYSYKRLLPRLTRALIRYRSLISVFYLFFIFMNFRKRLKNIPFC